MRVALFIFISIVSINLYKLSVHGSLHPTLSFPSSSPLHQSYRRCSSLVPRRTSPPFVLQKRRRLGDDNIGAEASDELVKGSVLKIGEGNDAVDAYFVKAVKNNNGVGILFLSDIYGFENFYNRDFADRVACIGYNVLMPDLFRGNPWSIDRPRSELDQWLAEQDPIRVANDLARSTQWLVDNFMTAESCKKLGIIGFCYGGARLLEVLAGDQDSVFATGVNVHGTRMNASVAPNIKVPVLFINGDNDPLSPVDIVKEIRNLIGKNSKVVVFNGRGHGFVHSPQSPEDRADAEKAFKIMRKWLHELLLDMS